MQQSLLSRKPFYAGSFYPADSQKLGSLIDTFISQAKKTAASGNLKILMVPHAGLDFSGRTAGWGFKQLEGKNYSKVIILGASHQSLFEHISVYPNGSWETPLGKAEIDDKLAGSLIDKKEKILFDPSAHKEEHSLEIELIFLQSILKNFKIVPVLIGQVQEETLSFLAQKIADNFDEETLLVVSTDLSHYPSWDIANRVDEEVVSSILTGDVNVFEKIVSDKNYPGVETRACGEEPVKVALKVAEILGNISFQKIKYENSGDVTGDKARVVGYAALGGWEIPKISSQNLLDEEGQKESLAIARNTLEKYLAEKIVPEINPKSKTLFEKYGAFVTLRKSSELRGCIGTFEPDEPLYKIIEKMVIAAATKDSRFLPVRENELKDIKIEVSVMTPKRRISDWKEIEMGKHGVVVKKGLRAGTFLPQVAEETGWTKERFLSELCTQKAGLSPTCYQEKDTEIYVFEAQVFEER